MKRFHYLYAIERAYRTHPIVAILGPRQCGKTTLARMYTESQQTLGQIVTIFDLEDPYQLQRLEDDPKLAFAGIKGLIIIDEIQRKPELFPLLRVLVDAIGNKQQFLILGSASRELIQQSSETLAGRIAYLELTPFNCQETEEIETLWLRGGFPRSYLAASAEDSLYWRKNYITTFLEQDVPNLGVKVTATNMRRFWLMLAHYHGGMFNASELGRSLGVAHTTVRNYLDILVGTFMIRELKPWLENIKKRQVKMSKIYFRDAGILHTLLNIPNRESLCTHPKLGASWEGFAMEEIIRHHQTTTEECYFWGTHGIAKLDLLLVPFGKKLGFEFKYAGAPRLTSSLKTAMKELGLEQIYVIFPGDNAYALADNIQAIGLQRYLAEHQ